MFVRLRSSPTQTVAATLVIFVQVAGFASAQDFSARSGSLNPFGVNGALPFGRFPDTANGLGIKGGLNSGIGLNTVYDNNFFLSETDPESEVTLSLVPSLSYSTDPEGGASNVFTASYSPSANWYLNHPELNGFDQNGSLALVISGSRTTISAFLSIAQQSGTDRLAGEFVTGSSFSMGIQANYQLAPRTSIYASFTPSITDYEQSSAVGFGGYSGSFGGFWAATELWSIGPSVSYSAESSDNTGDFESWTYSVNANYAATMRVQFGASLGVQVSKYERDPSSDGVSPTGSLNASYQINELWSWATSIQSGVLPSPTTSNYAINNWSVTTGLNRALLIGSVGIGADAQFSSYQRVGPTSVTEDDEKNYGLFLNYSRPFFSDRVGFNSSIRYSTNRGQDSYDQVQVSVGLNMAF